MYRGKWCGAARLLKCVFALATPFAIFLSCEGPKQTSQACRLGELLVIQRQPSSPFEPSVGQQFGVVEMPTLQQYVHLHLENTITNIGGFSPSQAVLGPTPPLMMSDFGRTLHEALRDDDNMGTSSACGNF
eukprot:6482037-Amphidinium_carterae.4